MGDIEEIKVFISGNRIQLLGFPVRSPSLLRMLGHEIGFEKNRKESDHTV
jgi:hypothetical protein